MRKIRNAVYLMFFIIGTLVTVSCTVNVEQKGQASKQEKKINPDLNKKVSEDWGGERTDRRPPRPMP